MSFTDAYALADDPEFQQRVTVALVKSSIAVMSEPPTDPDHVARAVYANKCLLSPEVEGMNMSLGVTTNPSITAESTDSDLEFTVNSLISAYAGVGAG